MAHDVFLCHSVTDKAVADAIVRRLESHSVKCWIAPRDVVRAIVIWKNNFLRLYFSSGMRGWSRSYEARSD